MTTSTLPSDIADLYELLDGKSTMTSDEACDYDYLFERGLVKSERLAIDLFRLFLTEHGHEAIAAFEADRSAS